MDKRKGLRIAFLVIFIAVLLFPVVWLVLTSFRPSANTRVNPAGLPTEFYLGNYELMGRSDWATAIQNSVITSISNVALCLAVSFPAAYAFTRCKFKADKHLFFWLLINRLGPPAAFIVPFLVLYHALGLFDNVLAIVIIHGLFNIPLGIWILSGFMKSIPREIDQAAFIDGYSLAGLWRRIFIPMMLSAIAITAFFIWMFSWTEMLLASTVTSNHAYTLPVQLRLTTASMGHGTLWGESAAAGVISMIPGLVLLFFVRKYITKGFTLGRI